MLFHTSPVPVFTEGLFSSSSLPPPPLSEFFIHSVTAPNLQRVELGLVQGPQALCGGGGWGGTGMGTAMGAGRAVDAPPALLLLLRLLRL